MRTFYIALANNYRAITGPDVAVCDGSIPEECVQVKEFLETSSIYIKVPVQKNMIITEV